MHPLTAADLLDSWEAGLTHPPALRPLVPLARACDSTLAEVAALPIGQRDGALLTLRGWSFGPTLQSVVSCPACAAQIEFAFEAEAIRTPPPPGDPPATVAATAAGRHARARLPTSLDLAALPPTADAASARRFLLARCLIESDNPAGDELPAALVAAIAAEMAAADPQAAVELALRCPTCAHAWVAPFDIGAFFWEEVNGWAQRLLGEIHTLARAYGWSEGEILALSPWRRHLYLGMISG